MPDVSFLAAELRREAIESPTGDLLLRAADALERQAKAMEQAAKTLETIWKCGTDTKDAHYPCCVTEMSIREYAIQEVAAEGWGKVAAMTRMADAAVKALREGQ